MIPAEFIDILVAITLIEMMVAIGLGVSFTELAAKVRNWRLVTQAARQITVTSPRTKMVALAATRAKCKIWVGRSLRNSTINPPRLFTCGLPHGATRNEPDHRCGNYGRRPVRRCNEDDDGRQFVIDDDGQAVYGVWLLADEPAMVQRKPEPDVAPHQATSHRSDRPRWFEPELLRSCGPAYPLSAACIGIATATL